MALLTRTESRIADANRVWQAACNVDITDWDKNDEFIISTWVVSTGTLFPGNFGTYNLKWRRVGGSFALVDADTEICWGTNTVLVDGNSFAAPDSSGCLPFNSGNENEGDNYIPTPWIPGGGARWECHWALGFGSGALDSQEYEIQLYSASSNATLQTSITTIEPSIIIIEATLQTLTLSIHGVTPNVWEMTLLGSGLYDRVGADKSGSAIIGGGLSSGQKRLKIAI